LGGDASESDGGDEALCVVAWIKRILRLKPSHFQNPAYCLFTTSDGKVLSSGKMA